MHEMFLDEDRPGQKELFNILKAYSILNPATGYCQAQAPIAAFLLMHLPAEQAFWSFVSICDKYLKDYFSPGMEMLQRDAKLFMALLKKTSPQAHRHLNKVKVEPLMFMTDWYLCAMTRTLKWDTLLRVWDCFLCEGIKVIFKVSLVIVGASLSSHKVRKNNKELCDTLGILKSPKPEFIEEEFIMHHISRLNITVEDFIVEHKRIEMQIRKQQQQNLI
jgi:TBC1 domain family member 10